MQRTSISVNIKERLDFSCALFGPDGGLVANAPHIPVHLGAMQARRTQSPLPYARGRLCLKSARPLKLFTSTECICVLVFPSGGRRR